MLKRLVSVGLLGLLLCHILAYMLVALRIGWQERRDLTHRLTVYRTVDSVVEFYVPLHHHADTTDLPQHIAEGFTHSNTYYHIISLEMQHDTLHVMGLPGKTHTLLNEDLFDFINQHFLGEAGQSQQKAKHLLKNLLKEYDPSYWVVTYTGPLHWRHGSPITAQLPFFAERAVPVDSPPPKA